MVIDLYSRAIIGFVVAERENSQLAAVMFADIFTRFPEVHIVYSDNRAAMTSKRLGKLFAAHGVARSLNRRECPIVCVRGLGLQVVRESVGVSHG